MRRSGDASGAGWWFLAAACLLAGDQVVTLDAAVEGVAFIQPDKTYQFTGNLTLGLRKSGDFLRFGDEIEQPGIQGVQHHSNTTYLVTLQHEFTRVEVTDLRTGIEESHGQLRTGPAGPRGGPHALYLSLVAPPGRPIHYSIRIFAANSLKLSFF